MSEKIAAEWGTKREWEIWAREQGFYEDIPAGDGRYVVRLTFQHTDGTVRQVHRQEDEPDAFDASLLLAQYMRGYREYVDSSFEMSLAIAQLRFGPLVRKGDAAAELELHKDRWVPGRRMMIVPGAIAVPPAHYESDGATYWPPRIERMGRQKVRLRVALNAHFCPPKLPSAVKLEQPRDFDAPVGVRDHYVHPVLLEYRARGIVAFMVGVPDENIVDDGYGPVLINAVGRVVGIAPSALTLRCVPVDLGHYIEGGTGT